GDQQINGLMLVGCGVPLLDGIGLAHVSDLAQDIRTAFPCSFRDFLEPVDPASEQAERASISRKLEHEGGPDAGAGAGNCDMCGYAATLHWQHRLPGTFLKSMAEYVQATRI